MASGVPLLGVPLLSEVWRRAGIEGTVTSDRDATS